MTLEAWRAAVFFAGLAVLLGVETLRPARPWTSPRLARLGFHAGLAAFNTLVLRFVAAAPLVLLLSKVRSLGWGLTGWLHLSGPLEIGASLIALDLLDYWWHRLNHTVGFFWLFHKVHHVDDHVDATTSLRFHTGELLLSAAMKAGWIVAVGPTLAAFAVFEAAITLAAQFHHSNIDFDDPLELSLRQVVVTPRFHAAHHTVSSRTREANFGTIFIVWDRLFGSYREPDREEMARLGLPLGRNAALSLGETALGPFRGTY